MPSTPSLQRFGGFQLADKSSFVAEVRRSLVLADDVRWHSDNVVIVLTPVPSDAAARSSARPLTSGWCCWLVLDSECMLLDATSPLVCRPDGTWPEAAWLSSLWQSYDAVSGDVTLPGRRAAPFGVFVVVLATSFGSLWAGRCLRGGRNESAIVVGLRPTP